MPSGRTLKHPQRALPGPLDPGSSASLEGSRLLFARAPGPALGLLLGRVGDPSAGRTIDDGFRFTLSNQRSRNGRIL